jgi:hypothetical protein
MGHDSGRPPAEETFRGSCRNKVPFPSKRQAGGRLRVMKKSPTTRHPAALNVYRCRTCHHWHIGTRYVRAGVPDTRGAGNYGRA